MANLARRHHPGTAQRLLCALAAVAAIGLTASAADAAGAGDGASAKASITLLDPATLSEAQPMSASGLFGGPKGGEVVIGAPGGASRASEPALIEVDGGDAVYELAIPERIAVGPLALATATLPLSEADGRLVSVGGRLAIPADAPAQTYVGILPVTAVFN